MDVVQVSISANTTMEKDSSENVAPVPSVAEGTKDAAGGGRRVAVAGAGRSAIDGNPMDTAEGVSTVAVVGSSTMAKARADIQNLGNQDQQGQATSDNSNVPQGKAAGTGSRARSYKEMLGTVKNICNSTDALQARICRLHCQYADAILKAAFLFDPATVQILTNQHEVADFIQPDDANITVTEVEAYYDGYLQERLQGFSEPMESEM